MTAKGPVHPRLVGRDAEIASLRAVLAEGRGAVVVGPAGIGKTSVAAEAVGGLPGVHWGGALSLLSYVPYLALARATGTPLGRGSAVSPDRIARDAIDRVGDGVLVLDDLHWAAPETLALLPRLAGGLRLIVAVRPGEPGSDRALVASTEARLERVDLGPLSAAAAGTLLDRLGLRATREERETILAGAQGNPFVLEELVAFPSTGAPALAASLRSRLRRLGSSEREAAELLALLGRPAEREILPASAAALVEAGIAHALPDGRLELRHALVEDAIRAELAPGALPARHRVLAAAVADPGERARHLAAAGERRQAHALALEAAAEADLPGERGRNLALAAASVDGPDSVRLALEAGRLLVEANDPDAVEALLEPLRCTSAAEEAERALVLGLSAFAAGDMPRYRHHVEAGLAIAEGSATAIEVELELAWVEIAAWEWDTEAPMRAAHALELALRAGAHVARARMLVASAAWTVLSPETPRLAEEALAAAEQEGDGPTEARARYSIVSYLMHEKGVDACRIAWDAFERRVTELGQEALAAEAGTVWLVENGLRRGGCDWVDEALDRVRARRAGMQEAYAWAWIVTAVADAGDDRRALALLEESRSVERQGAGAAAICWAEAEAHLAAGRLDDARAVLATLPHDHDSDVEMTRSMLAFHDRSPRPMPADAAPLWPGRFGLAFVTATALARAADPGEDGTSGATLEALADAWEPYVHRNAARCLWAAGEAARRAGERARATDLLRRAEALAEAGVNVPLLALVRRSLVEAGVRPHRRPQPGALTARERDVLELVGAGHSSPEIARRLGLSRGTVDGYVTSAMRKLGASTRAQAAALLSTGT